MPLSLYALDRFVSQDLAQLSECCMRGVADEFPEREYWLTNFVLNAMLRSPLPERKRALAFAVIRRASAAIRDYEEARLMLTELTGSQKTVSLYFHCLDGFESTVAMVCQALEFMRKALGIKLYNKGDGSPYDRLYKIYNEGRHKDPDELPTGHLHAVWIGNGLLLATNAHLSFAELRDLVSEVGRIADKLSGGLAPD